VGVFALQTWNEIGLQLYGGYRRHEARRLDSGLKPLYILALGAIYLL
jgi:hypothetical protein